MGGILYSVYRLQINKTQQKQQAQRTNKGQRESTNSICDCYQNNDGRIPETRILHKMQGNIEILHNMQENIFRFRTTCKGNK